MEAPPALEQAVLKITVDVLCLFHSPRDLESMRRKSVDRVGSIH